MPRRRTGFGLPVIRVAALFALAACGKIGIDKRDEHGMTALMRAAKRGDRAEAERLIERGASVNAAVPSRDLRELIAFISWMQELPSSDIGYTALHYAADGSHPDVARLLIAKGADVHRAARGGGTAFDLAVLSSDLATMELLTGAGVRPEPRHLAMAVRLSSPEAVQFLLQHGADPNARASPDPRATAPPPPPVVLVASERVEPAVLKLLIDAGADVNARDNGGKSVLEHAAQHPEVQEELRRAGAR